MSEAPWQQQPPVRRGLSSGWGMLIGGVVGFLGPVLIYAFVQMMVALDVGVSFGGIAALLIAVMPLPLLVLGLVLVFIDRVRGWGVAALVAAGVWLVTSAGVCVVALVSLSSA